METQLIGPHRTTFDAVFQYPVARNLAWRDVVSMLAALEGAAHEERNGTLKVRRNGKVLVLHQPVRRTMTDIQEVMNLRRFLESSDGRSPQQEKHQGI